MKFERKQFLTIIVPNNRYYRKIVTEGVAKLPIVLNHFDLMTDVNIRYDDAANDSGVLVRYTQDDDTMTSNKWCTRVCGETQVPEEQVRLCGHEQHTGF